MAHEELQRVAEEKNIIAELQTQVQDPEDQAVVDGFKAENEAMEAKLSDPRPVTEKILPRIPKYRHFDASGNLLSDSEVQEVRQKGNDGPYNSGRRA